MRMLKGNEDERNGVPPIRRKSTRTLVENIKPAPEDLAVSISYKIPEPVVNSYIAGALNNVIHGVMGKYLVRVYVLKRKGRRYDLRKT